MVLVPSNESNEVKMNLGDVGGDVHENVILVFLWSTWRGPSAVHGLLAEIVVSAGFVSMDMEIFCSNTVKSGCWNVHFLSSMTSRILWTFGHNFANSHDILSNHYKLELFFFVNYWTITLEYLNIPGTVL